MLHIFTTFRSFAFQSFRVPTSFAALALFAIVSLFSGQTSAQQQICTPTTTVTEGDLFPGGIPSFGVSSGPGSVTIDHVDAGTGTRSITVVGVPTNATVNIPAFVPSTFAPVNVTFTQVNPALPSSFTLRAASLFHAIFIRVTCGTVTPTPTPGASPTPVASPTPNPTPTPTPLPCIFANGNFETNSFAGWTVFNQAGGSGSWFTYTGNTSPLSSFTNLSSPPEGMYAAVTDQTGPGTHILYRDVTVPAGTSSLSFYLYYINRANRFVAPPTLDYTVNPNQQYRVDVMRTSAPIMSVASGDVLANLFITNPGAPLTLAPTLMNYDISAFAGQTIRLRFAAVDNQSNFNASVDAVCITGGSVPTPTPTPTPTPVASPTPTPTPTPSPCLATRIPSVTASTNMGSGFGTNIQNTVNGVGLSSLSLTATHAPTNPANSWVSTGTLTGTVTFNLGGTFVVDSFSFWNQNGGGPGANGITGIQGVTVSTSTDGITFTPLTGGPTSFAQVAVNATVPPQIFNFTPVSARFFRFTILSNYGDPAQTGFAEVGFRAVTCTPTPTPTPTPDANVDFNGDGRSDYVVTRNISGSKNWYVSINGSGAFSGTQFGTNTDVEVPEDYDGDRRDDIAVYRRGAQGVFYILQSSNNTFRTELFGLGTDDPKVTADYDGDNKADVAVYRTSAGGQNFYYYKRSIDGVVISTPWGSGVTVRPNVGDYDGDNRADFCVHINNGGGGNGLFALLKSTGGTEFVPFGIATDRLAPGDYDGDGKSDFTVVRSQGGSLLWYTLTRTNVFSGVAWGIPTDIITPGDYDGDGKQDQSVWRSSANLSQSSFYTRRSTNGGLQAFAFGAGTDYPAANWYVHEGLLLIE
jgi:hypothetical protein